MTVQLTPLLSTVDLKTNTWVDTWAHKWAEQIKSALIETEPDQVRDPPPYLTHAHLFAPFSSTFKWSWNARRLLLLRGCWELSSGASTKLCHQSGPQVHVLFGEVSRTSSYSMVCAPSGLLIQTSSLLTMPKHSGEAGSLDSTDAEVMVFVMGRLLMKLIKIAADLLVSRTTASPRCGPE